MLSFSITVEMSQSSMERMSLQVIVNLDREKNDQKFSNDYNHDEQIHLLHPAIPIIIGN